MDDKQTTQEFRKCEKSEETRGVILRIFENMVQSKTTNTFRPKLGVERKHNAKGTADQQKKNPNKYVFRHFFRHRNFLKNALTGHLLGLGLILI